MITPNDNDGDGGPGAAGAAGATGAAGAAGENVVVESPAPSQPGSPASGPTGAAGEGREGEFRFGLNLARDADGRQALVIRPGLPVAGAFALVFGIVGLFRLPLLMGPLAMLVGGIAMLRGDRGAGLLGLALGVAGLLTDGTFWTLAGLGWLWTEFF